MPSDHALAAAILATVAALCGLTPPAVRRSLLEGLRCMGRYSALWRIPALFGIG
jgi:membrane-associated phospholipid phosphatase